MSARLLPEALKKAEEIQDWLVEPDPKDTDKIYGSVYGLVSSVTARDNALAKEPASSEKTNLGEFQKSWREIEIYLTKKVFVSIKIEDFCSEFSLTQFSVSYFCVGAQSHQISFPKKLSFGPRETNS